MNRLLLYLNNDDIQMSCFSCYNVKNRKRENA